MSTKPHNISSHWSNAVAAPPNVPVLRRGPRTPSISPPPSGCFLLTSELPERRLLQPSSLPDQTTPMFSESRQSWRAHPSMRMATNVPRMAPGLGWATGIFGVYVFAEAFYNRLPAKKEMEVHVPEVTASTDAAAGSSS